MKQLIKLEKEITQRTRKNRFGFLPFLHLLRSALLGQKSAADLALAQQATARAAHLVARPRLPVGEVGGAEHGLAIGIAQEVATYPWIGDNPLVPPAYKNAVAFFVMVCMLVWRPTGIFKGRVL